MIPDVSDLGLTVIDGDVVVPANDTLEKKGLDFDSFLGGLFKWRNGIVYYWFGEGKTGIFGKFAFIEFPRKSTEVRS